MPNMPIYEPHKIDIDTDDYSLCPGCLGSLKGKKPVVAHTGNGHLHPIHRECAREWLKHKRTCPTCRTEIDVNGMLSLKERCIQRYGQLQKYVNKSTLLGGATALAIGAVMRSVLLLAAVSIRAVPIIACLEGFLGAVVGFVEEDPWPTIKQIASTQAAIYLIIFFSFSVIRAGAGLFGMPGIT